MIRPIGLQINLSVPKATGSERQIINYSQLGDSGQVVGIDHIDELVKISIANINKDEWLANLLEKGCIKMVVGDGRNGYQQLAPYDAIHVGAAVPKIPQAVSEEWRHRIA